MAIDWLIIAEKESQAMDYAKGLFDLGRPKGNLIKGGLGGTNISSVLDGTVVITRAQGHLFEMAMPDVQNEIYDRKGEATVNEWGMVTSSGWKSDLEMLEHYPVKLDLDHIKYDGREPVSRMRGIARNIGNLMKKADKIVVATDADAEGEMIFRICALQVLGQSLREPNGQKLYRVLPASLDPVSVRKMFQETLQRYDEREGKLGQFYQSLAPQGFARAVADYEFGITYSLLGSFISSEIGEGENTHGFGGVWGRLKNTILGHVRQAERAHDAFVESSKWRIDMVADGGVLQGCENLMFDTRAKAQAYIDSGRLPEVVAIAMTEEDKATLPPKLYSRAELLGEADSKLSGKVDWPEVLQRDYEEHKVLTYPRTDSQHIGEGEFKGLKAYLNNETIQQLMQQRMAEVAQKVEDGSAKAKVFREREPLKRWVDEQKITPHYAIIPNTALPFDEFTIRELSEDDFDLYKLSLYQTMAMFVSDSITRVRSFTALPLKGGGYAFSKSFKEPLEQGWRLLVGNIDKGDASYPKEGKQRVTYTITEVEAKRPSLLTESSLLALLKRRNEGTSATRDATIKQMIDRGGLKRGKGKKLRVNPSLHKVIDVMLEKHWINMDQTGEWQKEIDQISSWDQADAFIYEVRKETEALQRDIEDAFNVKKGE